MVDGVMVVSPVVKFEPKDGDVVHSGTSVIAIFKEINSETSYSAYAALEGGAFRLYFEHWNRRDLRPATEEEKKRLFDKLAKKGLAWDAERKELVKIKWKPYEGGEFWLPYYDTIKFAPTKRMFNLGRDKNLLASDWYFKTEQECQEFCKRLNEAINSVKP